MRAHRRRRRGGARRAASTTRTRRRTCATRRSRRSTCSRRRTPARTCRRRSSSTRPTATSTTSCSWPRAAARRTRACCSRRPRRCSTRRALAAFLDQKLRSLGTAACPPYHLAVVIGGTSAEHTLKVAKLASARYLDHLPTKGIADGPRVSRPRVGAEGRRDRAHDRHRRAVRRQVLLPRRARDPAAAPRRELPGRDRGQLLGGSPGARQDHARRRVPRAARARSGEVPARRHARRARRRGREDRSDACR